MVRTLIASPLLFLTLVVLSNPAIAQSKTETPKQPFLVTPASAQSPAAQANSQAQSDLQASAQSNSQATVQADAKIYEPEISPFAYIKNKAVGQEIELSSDQLAAVQKLQPVCDYLCQQQVNETLNLMPQELKDVYAALPFNQRMSALALLEQDAQETMELEMLSGRILNFPQMLRFRQLWAQQLGVDALLFGTTSRIVGTSEEQKDSIVQIQNAGDIAIDASFANPDLSSDQRNFLIRRIQKTVIDQTINVLTAQQIDTYIAMCGERFVPNQQKNSTTGENPDGETPSLDGEPNTEFDPLEGDGVELPDAQIAGAELGADANAAGTTPNLNTDPKAKNKIVLDLAQPKTGSKSARRTIKGFGSNKGVPGFGAKSGANSGKAPKAADQRK